MSFFKEQLEFHWKDFHEIWYLRIFQKPVEEIQVSLISHRNNGHFTWRCTYIYGTILINSSSNEKCFRQKLNRKSEHTLCTTTFFLKLCHLWDNVEKYGRAGQVTDDNTAHALGMLGNGVNLWSHLQKKKKKGGPMIIDALTAHHITIMTSYIGAWWFNPYPTAFPYGNGMVLHFYQQQESSTTKTVHKVINKGLKAYV